MWGKVTDWVHKWIVVMTVGVVVFGIPEWYGKAVDVWREVKALGRRVVRRLRK